MTRILGIDPGLRVAGYGCIEGTADQPTIIEAGVIRLVRSSPTPSVPDRLFELERDFEDLLDRVEPEAVAIEALFAHQNFPATAITMAHGRGVMLLCARRRNLRLIEYKPAAIKNAVAGSGQANKAQIQRSVQARFGLAEPPSPPDVADALAVALCAMQRLGLGLDDPVDPADSAKARQPK